MDFDDLKDFFFDDADLVIDVTIETIAGTRKAIRSSADKSVLVYGDAGLTGNLDSTLKMKVEDFTSVAEIKGLNQKKVTIGTEVFRISSIEFDSRQSTWNAVLEAKFK